MKISEVEGMIHVESVVASKSPRWHDVEARRVRCRHMSPLPLDHGSNLRDPLPIAIVLFQARCCVRNKTNDDVVLVI
ncbi:hypothetical protein TNCV_4021671 [Trichonephila clavipes]|nr:hypothetical protein TNCV_4021671 [Trichonephila clavipes]